MSSSGVLSSKGKSILASNGQIYDNNWNELYTPLTWQEFESYFQIVEQAEQRLGRKLIRKELDRISREVQNGNNNF
jgi:hypothetical protein